MALRDHEAARAAIANSGGLINVTGLSRRWGITRQAVQNRKTWPGFPQPIPIEGTDQAVWLEGEISAWEALSVSEALQV